MLDQIEILLRTDIGKVPPRIRICIGDDVIFDRFIEKDTELKHQTKLNDHLVMKIEKSGKTKELADSGEHQSVIVEKVLLNGLDLHAGQFGVFHQKDNSYVNDQSIEGNELSLNGSWLLDVPVFRQPFLPDEVGQRQTLSDAKIACFGCSATHGAFLEEDETWPHYLGSDARNFGVGGNSISSIIGTARRYVDDFRCEKLIMLLPHVCRLQLEHSQDGINTLIPFKFRDLKGDLKALQRKIVLFGEPSLLFSGYLPKAKELLSEINNKTELYLSSYQTDTYEFIEKHLNGCGTILPFYKKDENIPLASDNQHPGPGHNRIFADNIRPIVGG